jgi:hypothetical protein
MKSTFYCRDFSSGNTLVYICSYRQSRGLPVGFGPARVGLMAWRGGISRVRLLHWPDKRSAIVLPGRKDLLGNMAGRGLPPLARFESGADHLLTPDYQSSARSGPIEGRQNPPSCSLLHVPLPSPLSRMSSAGAHGRGSVVAPQRISDELGYFPNTVPRAPFLERADRQGPFRRRS